MQAIAALFLWLESLYHLRSFESTGYLIHSIEEVVAGMLVFLFVLSISIIAFADAFSSLSIA